jgi:hypothetical protein
MERGLGIFLARRRLRVALLLVGIGTNSRSDPLDKLLTRGADPFAPVNENSPISIVERGLESKQGNLGDLLLTNSPSPAVTILHARETFR